MCISYSYKHSPPPANYRIISHNLLSKAALYKCIVPPILEYTSPVLYLNSSGDIKQLESVYSQMGLWKSVTDNCPNHLTAV